jgi:hypothetical protein
MMLLEIHFQKWFFFASLFTAVTALLYTYGWQIVKDMRKEDNLQEVSSVTSKQVSAYFISKGYVVCSVIPVKNSTNWLVFLIKNGDYEAVTVFTSNDAIVGFQENLV